MAVLTKQKVGLSVNVTEKSVTYMVNTLFHIAFRVAKERGLTPDYITNYRDILERGFFTWLAEQTLESMHIEIMAPDGSKALERWDVTFDYSTDTGSEVRKPPVEEMADICKKLRSLPKGSSYRIMVMLKPGSSKVEGWQDSSFLPFNQSGETALSNWGLGSIDAKMLYRDGTW